jgi:hypothetical protein
MVGLGASGKNSINVIASLSQNPEAKVGFDFSRGNPDRDSIQLSVWLFFYF